MVGEVLTAGMKCAEVLSVLPRRDRQAAARGQLAIGNDSAVGIWEFPDDSANPTYRDFLCRLDRFTTGITVEIYWMAKNGTITNEVQWAGGVRAIPDDTEVLSADHTFDMTDTVDATAPTAADEVDYAALVMAGAELDSLADGDLFIFRLQRNSDVAADDFADTAQVLGFTITTTANVA